MMGDQNVEGDAQLRKDMQRAVPRIRLGTSVRIVGIVVCLVGLALVLTMLMSGRREPRSFDGTVSAIEQQMPTQRHPAIVGTGPSKPLSSVSVGRDDYVGILDIPRLDRRLPVLSPADEAAEEPIATYGNAADGNLVIEASNTTGIFRDLTQIPDGDALYFTDVTGAVYSYHVLTVESIENDDVSALRERSDEWDLTLAAPSFSGQQKTLLRCAADS